VSNYQLAVEEKKDSFLQLGLDPLTMINAKWAISNCQLAMKKKKESLSNDQLSKGNYQLK
jgi:hypothetical protein